MTLARPTFGIGCFLVATGSLLACSGGGRSDSAGASTGTAVFAIANAPPDAACLQIVVTGSRTVQKSFDLTPGQAASFTLKGLPVGAVTFSEQTFGVACALVTPATTATWVSDPVPATLTAGMVAQVAIVLRRNGQAVVTSNFNDDGGTTADVGGTDVGTTPDAGADSGSGGMCTFFYDDNTLPLLGPGGVLPPLP